MTQRKRKGPKFRVGDTVMDTISQEQFVVGIRHFDPCDGWEYGPETVGVSKRLYFEEDLKLLTRREGQNCVSGNMAEDEKAGTGGSIGITEQERQRRSFAYGNVSLSNLAVTREMIDQEAGKMTDQERLRAELAGNYEVRAKDFVVWLSGQTFSGDHVIGEITGKLIKFLENEFALTTPTGSTESLRERSRSEITKRLGGDDGVPVGNEI